MTDKQKVQIQFRSNFNLVFGFFVSGSENAKLILIVKLKLDDSYSSHRKDKDGEAESELCS